MSDSPVIVWLRNDLRLNDHPAFFEAAQTKRPVIAVYIYSPEEEQPWPMGGASLWWLHHTLVSLTQELKALNIPLIIKKGSSLSELQHLIEITKATSVYWTRRYEPYSMMRDTEVKKALKEKGIEAESFNGQLLFEPWTVNNKLGNPFQVFTYFYRHCLSLPAPREPLPFEALRPCSLKIPSLRIEDLEFLPKIHWDKGLAERWKPGEKGAFETLKIFLENSIDDYKTTRDFPSLEQGVSHLSPYLHFGEISPFQIWHAAIQHKMSESFLRQLIWREFAHSLLFHFPFTPDTPLRKEFARFPWDTDLTHLKKWQQGLTGYPIVDAGMRELWQTGWMHNRVRMIVGSFLVKDLRIDWIEGEKWFWNTLVDADLANNCMGWQWIAGCGADAAPYFRIFNPTTQSEKFDPEGKYIRKYVPELKDLPTEWIHQPSEAPPLILRQAGVQLGKDYPYPCIDHKKAREEALAALKSIK